MSTQAECERCGKLDCKLKRYTVKELAAIGKKPILETVDVAAILHWRVQRAERWLQREEAARKTNGGRLITTPQRLRDSFREVVDAILTASAEGDF